MEIKKLKELLIKFEKNIVYNQDLKKKNWFNIGGKTKVFYKAEELKDLIDFLIPQLYKKLSFFHQY